MTINESETDLNRNKSTSSEAIHELSEVTVPEKLEPHKIDLKNRGNSCFLNSILQALMKLPMFITDATNLKRAVQSVSSSLDMKAVKLASPFTSLCPTQVSRTNYMAASGKTNMETMDGHKVQDAKKFLCRFMDELKENTSIVRYSLGLKKIQRLWRWW